MKTLKELINQYGFFLSDTEICELYYTINGLEEEAINSLSNIAKKKINELKNNQDILIGKLNCFSPFEGEGYSSDFIIAINRSTIRIVAGLDLIPSDIETLKKEVPKYPTPKIMWRELYEKLKEMGIYFKGDK